MSINNINAKKLLITSSIMISCICGISDTSIKVKASQVDVSSAVKKEVNPKNIASGTFGTSPWYITDKGVLHIGTGEFSDTGYQSPWKDYASRVTSVVFDGKVVAAPDSSRLFLEFNQCTKIENIRALDTKNVTTMQDMFLGMSELTDLDITHFDTQNVTNMRSMFHADLKLKKLDLSTFDTTRVTTMENMFNNLPQLTQLDLSNFDTTNTTSIMNMLASSPISELKLGSKTKLDTTVNLGIHDTSGLYNGKWQTMGTGTPTLPNGNWVGTTDDLIARTALGNADTYVLQRSHNYVFTANNIEVKQSDVAKLDVIKASKANVKDTVNPSATFNIEVKDKGGLTNKVGTYKVVLSAKGLTDVTKTINVKVVADSKPKPQPNVKYQAVYRLYNKNTGEHFYTESAFERDSLVKGGWNNEGTGWSAPDKGTAVYRVYNPNAKGGDHYYTASKFEADSLVKTGWKWDNAGKPVFYSGGKTSVYVAFNPNAVASGSHNYTSNSFEQQSLLKNGWKFGKVQFYGK